MDFIEQIHACQTDEELNELVTKRIAELDENATKIEQIGFVGPGRDINVFKGFIPFNTRIKYDSLSIASYSMSTVDFFYSFASIVKKNNLRSKAQIIYALEIFMNRYFGYPGKVSRDTIFEEIAFSTTETDDELWEALANNSIGDLKGKGAAECTERGALANQLLSLFDFDVYMTIGCLDNNGKEEAHCFNVVKRKNDYALLDYSVTTTNYDDLGNVICFYPFIGSISNEDFESFLNGDKTVTFNDHVYISKRMQENDHTRSYVVGKYTLKQENTEGVRVL